MVHDLHPLDQVVSIEEVQVLNDLKVLLSRLFVRNVDALVDHWVLQDEEVEEAEEEYLVILDRISLLPHVVAVRVVGVVAAVA